MIKKVLFVFGLALIVQTITGCVDCNCGPIRKIYITKTGLTLNALDSSLPQPMVSQTGVIASANFGFQLLLRTAHVAVRKQQVNWRLIQTAQACSCAEDDFISKEDVLSVEIFSNNDFDASHPKNTDLSVYFEVKNYKTMVPLAEYIKRIKDSNYLARTAFFEGIFLTNAPTINKMHKFRVKITLSDGRILEAETPEVELT
ncbi:DUF5034 domain-containing protein [Pedobacter insulae]|uniref:DUF5034 domain-containing protein n=1 Tax=Pedobacter insulae TaxID=414048 RepID=A0A1I2YWW5_9SPHI|nr:DUF5034 domain-containing protein [Pedobacter insulae]SFH30137.1 protein of unknown function [Pedobacter insulae]